jgi:hypothetical protein
MYRQRGRRLWIQCRRFEVNEQTALPQGFLKTTLDAEMIRDLLGRFETRTCSSTSGGRCSIPGSGGTMPNVPAKINAPKTQVVYLRLASVQLFTVFGTASVRAVPIPP